MIFYISGFMAYSVRIAHGALYIKERLGLSDRETAGQITENPYLQYFIGLPEFQEKSHHSLMPRFRKRLEASIINELMNGLSWDNKNANWKKTVKRRRW